MEKLSYPQLAGGLSAAGHIALINMKATLEIYSDEISDGAWNSMVNNFNNLWDHLNRFDVTPLFSKKEYRS